MQSSGQYHLPTAHHATPPTVGRDGGAVNLSEIGSVGHPGNGVEVLPELQYVRRGSFWAGDVGVSWMEGRGREGRRRERGKGEGEGREKEGGEGEGERPRERESGGSSVHILHNKLSSLF